MERTDRISTALAACLEGVRLAHREGQGVVAAPLHWRWVCVGLVSALKAALVTALSGYETARDEDIADPSEPSRMAPITLLLRRASAAQYLNAPEQLDLPRSLSQRVDRVIALRNATLHALGGDVPETILPDVSACLNLIEHLTLKHPAFDPAPHVLVRVALKDEISAFRTLLSARG